MKTLFQNRWLWLILRLLLGAIFVAASITKIADTKVFVNTVVSYDLLPEGFARLYGWIIPWVELFVGCSLVLGVFIRLISVLSLPLTLSFVVASSYALANGAGGTCGCFGNFINLSHSLSLTIDGVMLLMAIVLIFHKENVFLTIGQAFDRIKTDFKNKSPLCYRASLIASVVVVMALVTLVIFVVKTPAVSQSEDVPITENLTIPSPFAADIEKSLAEGKPVMLDVYAEGCEPCEAIATIIDDFEKEYEQRVTFIRIDYYEYTQQLNDIGVKATPTLIFVARKNIDSTFGVHKRLVGLIYSDLIKQALEKIIQ
jgi:thiol-disulfide isomerase/thioredoxin/uncharacterized membrane protein YphA (DoxX/SURF4 family)